jgi:hypothetical protein
MQESAHTRHYIYAHWVQSSAVETWLRPCPMLMGTVLYAHMCVFRRVNIVLPLCIKC